MGKNIQGTTRSDLFPPYEIAANESCETCALQDPGMRVLAGFVLGEYIEAKIAGGKTAGAASRIPATAEDMTALSSQISEGLATLVTSSVSSVREAASIAVSAYQSLSPEEAVQLAQCVNNRMNRVCLEYRDTAEVPILPRRIMTSEL